MVLCREKCAPSHQNSGNQTHNAKPLLSHWTDQAKPDTNLNTVTKTLPRAGKNVGQ